MVKNVISNIINIICIIVIILSIVLMLSVFLGSSQGAPSLFGYSAFRVISGSMEPTIQQDSFVLVKKVDPSTLAEGDVISFYSRDPALMGAVNTHRLIEIAADDDGKTVFVTKGDANSIADEYVVYPETVIGKVVGVSRVLGMLLRLLANPIVFIPLIIVPIIVLLVMNIRHAVVTTKELIREEEQNALEEARALIEQQRAEKAAEEAAEAAEAVETAASDAAKETLPAESAEEVEAAEAEIKAEAAETVETAASDTAEQAEDEEV